MRQEELQARQKDLNDLKVERQACAEAGTIFDKFLLGKHMLVWLK